MSAGQRPAGKDERLAEGWKDLECLSRKSNRALKGQTTDEKGREADEKTSGFIVCVGIGLLCDGA